MKDQPPISGDNKGPPRHRSIPDDFLWDEETQAWYAPGEPSMYDAAAASRELQEILKQERRGGLISRDQLLAAGALITPETRRKTLGGGPKRKLDLFDAMLGDDDSNEAEELEPEEADDESAE